MSVAITMEDSKESLRHGLNLIHEEYEDLEYEPGFWEKAWRETKKHGHAFLVLLGKELKMIWERGGREIVTFGALYGLVWLIVPAALPAVAAVAPALIPMIIWRAFKAA
jgi:hypothetical protein